MSNVLIFRGHEQRNEAPQFVRAAIEHLIMQIWRKTIRKRRDDRQKQTQ